MLVAGEEKLNNQEAASLLKQKDSNVSPSSPSSPPPTGFHGNKNIYRGSPTKTVNEDQAKELTSCEADDTDI